MINNSSKMKNFPVIFNKDGDLVIRPTSWNMAQYIKEDNKIFSDVLEYTGYISAGAGGNTHMQFKSLNSKRLYSMFMSDFDDVLQNKKMKDNIVIGDFYFCKKGNSQGLRLIL